jgi:protein SCO1/2
MIKARLTLLATVFAGLFSMALIADEGVQSLDSVQVSFELTDHGGNSFTEKNLQGRYVLLAFGFTHCKHICPMMAANMGLALSIAGDDAMGVFISVDTERDSPEVAHAYASKFNKAMIGLGGDYEQIQNAARNFGVSFVVTKSQKAYTVEHTSDIFLIDPEGRLVETYALNANPAEIAAAMHQ